MNLRRIMNNQSTPCFAVCFLSLLLSILSAPFSKGENTSIDGNNSGGDSPIVSSEEAIDFWDEYEIVEPVTAIADPLQPINRVIFRFNDSVYAYLLTPLAKGYSKLIPLSVRQNIDNFYTNWAFPVRLVNTALQGKFERSVRETERFLVNTTLGIGGLFDPASEWDDLSILPAEDLGQSLGHWGLGHGFYLVLPLIGPSSARDLVGRVGDGFLDPINYIDNNTVRVALHAEAFINRSPTLMDAYQALNEAATDPYIALRDAYSQRRKKDLKD